MVLPNIWYTVVSHSHFPEISDIVYNTWINTFQTKVSISYPGFNLTFWNAVVKIFVTNLSFSDLMLGAEGRKILLLQIVPNQIFSMVPENNFFWNY